MNMRPELKRAIRRHEFGDYDQLTTLVTGVERMLETLKVERVPPRPEKSFFPEFAYSSKNMPRSFPSNKENPGREADATVNRLLHSVAEMSKKLDDLKSRSERTNGCNQRAINQTGLNRNYKQLNNNNNSVVPNRGTGTARQGDRDPVTERTPKTEPPCFNCGKEDHMWRQCPTPRVRFCHICGKHDRVKQRCDSEYCQENVQRRASSGVNAPPFVPQPTLNSIMTKFFFN